jgi:hypothetical protein
MDSDSSIDVEDVDNMQDNFERVFNAETQYKIAPTHKTMVDRLTEQS